MTDNSKRSLLIGVSAAVATMLALAVIFVFPLFLKGAPSDAVIRIPANATETNIRDSLIRYLGEDYAALVMRIASLKGTDFSSRHGAYLIEEGVSPFRAERRLSKGAQHPLTITVNGFRSADLLAEKLSRRLDFSADSLKNALGAKNALDRYGLSSGQALALFLDDSYEVYWTVSPDELIKKIGANYNKVWNEERKAKASALGLNPAQIMVICSIVDEETNKTDEKGKSEDYISTGLRPECPCRQIPQSVSH